jgi:hypothetical protein
MRVTTNLQLGRHDRPVRRERRDRSIPQAVHIHEASAEQRGDDQANCQQRR